MSEVEKAMRIEKDVPLPPKYPKYPVREMNIGDSVFVPGLDAGKASGRFYSAARACGLQMKFTARQVAGGTRVWRIE